MLSLESSILSIMYVRLCHTYLWSLLNYSRGTHCTLSQRSLEWLLKQFREPMVFKMLISSMKVTCEFIYWFQLCLLFIETSSWLRGTLHWESLWPLQPIVSHWCKILSLSHFSFTLELEGLRDQGRSTDMTYLHWVLHGMQWILLHALLDFVTTQNEHSSCMIQPSDELHESSQFHGHGPWP